MKEIENKHFFPNPQWDSFEEMVLSIEGIPLPFIEEVAKLGGSVGIYNQKRIEWLDQVWMNYQTIMGNCEK